MDTTLAKRLPRKRTKTTPPSAGSPEQNTTQCLSPASPAPGSDMKALHTDYEMVRNLYKSPASPGEVDLYRHKLSGQEVAVKKVLKRRLLCVEQVASAVRELEIHSTLCHPNIVNCLVVGESEDCYALAMEFVPDFDYFRVRLEEENKPFYVKPEGAVDKLRAFAYDILNALQYLHGVGVVHLDLKPANLLLDRNVTEYEYPIVKLCDFGLSRRVDASGTATVEKRCGTDPYIAPEVRDNSQVTVAADMWSFGLLLYQMAAGYLPTVMKWRPGEKLTFLPRYWRKYEGTGLTELIEACLQVEPGRRISAADALAHRWFIHTSANQ